MIADASRHRHVKTCVPRGTGDREAVRTEVPVFGDKKEQPWTPAFPFGKFFHHVVHSFFRERPGS
jgi:hypothetical protein